MMLTLVLVFAFNPAARAGSFTQDFSVAAGTGIGWDNIYEVRQISLLRGQTLNDVQISEIFNVQSTFTVTNKSIYTSTITTDKVTVALSDPYGTHNSTLGFIGSSTLPSNKQVTFGPYSEIQSNNYTFTLSTDMADMAPFIGGGINYYEVASDVNGTTFAATHSGQIGNNVNTTAGMALEVIYDYSGTGIVLGTPEPSAGILIGVGGLMCWGWRRTNLRRRSCIRSS